MARKPNYDFEKRRKEQERKAKKEARAEEKRLRKEEGGEGGAPIMTLEEMGLPPRVIPDGE